MRTIRTRLVRILESLIPTAALFLLIPAAAFSVNLASVTANPTTVVSGSPLEVTVVLDTVAPAGGVLVTLSSTDPGIVAVESQIVAAGAISKSYLVKPQTVAVSTPVTIEASYAGLTKTAMVTVTPRTPVRGAAGDLWADVILGQPDFGEITVNEVTGGRVANPGGVIVDRSVTPNRLYVYDGLNSRVLGLDHLGTCQGLPTQMCTANSDCGANGPCAIEEGRSADLVLGQPSLTTSACNGEGNFQLFPQRAPAGADTLCTLAETEINIQENLRSASMAVDGAGNLYVPDYFNHRVLRYDSPFTTDTIADYVWGQADFSGKECNRGRGIGLPDDQSLCSGKGYTNGVALDSNGNLWVTDGWNHRVLRFPKDPATGIPLPIADLVLGQDNFTSGQQGLTLARMLGPLAVRVDGSGAVYVADSNVGGDTSLDRVLIFDPPLSSGKAARKLNYPFHVPSGLELDPGGGIWVNDTHNSQLLLFVGGAVQKVLFKDVPDSSRTCCGQTHVIIGDGPPFESGGENGRLIDSHCMCDSFGSIGIDSDGNVFATAANEWQDLWRFPAPIPTPRPGVARSADKRIFEPYFVMGNFVGPAGFIDGRGVVAAAGQLIASDAGRLLFWNDPANLTNGQPADGVVGPDPPSPFVNPQPYFTRIRQDGASRLWAIRYDKIVAYSLPLTTGASPIVTISSPLPILGGGSMTWDGVSLEVGGIAPVGMGDKLWVAVPKKNRVFRVRNPLTSPVVDIILGQTSATGTSCNRGAAQPSANSLCEPGAVALDPQGNLYVSDHATENTGNQRLLEFDASLFPDSPASALFGIRASRVFGTGGSFTTKGCEPLFPEPLCVAPFEPAFTPDGQMVVGWNGHTAPNSPQFPNGTGPRFPYVYTNPLVSQKVSTFLNDFHSMGYASTFDSSGNLYVADLNRDRVLIYFNPFPSPPPPVYTLTVTKTGGGTGTVKSTPFGIDCGTACSQSFIDGASVTLSTIPGANAVFTGWSGDPDCSDGVLTMSAAKTCTARFELKPDLIVFALTAPASALAGSTISVNDTTKNQAGTGQAAASTSKFYLSANSTWDAGDTVIGSRSIPALNAGATNSDSTNVTIPAGTATGSYYIIAKADADRILTESNETNNTKYASIRISPPDLIVSAVSVPTTGGAGTSITATNTTKNQTNTGPAPASTTRFYLSANATWDTGDTLIGSQAVGALKPGVSEAHSTSLTIPAGTTPGTKYVIAKADADGLIPETLETNNTRSDTIVIGPDLIVSVLGAPASAAAGATISVTDTTKNQGGGQAAASTTSFYLSTNTTYEAGDTSLGSRAIPQLAYAATSAGSTSVTIPAGTAAGTWYVLARADATGAVAETSEANNVKSKVLTITP